MFVFLVGLINRVLLLIYYIALTAKMFGTGEPPAPLPQLLSPGIQSFSTTSVLIKALKMEDSSLNSQYPAPTEILGEI